ncbi:MAG: SDR family oxidoreductase [Rhizobiales bacterium]|nr:SDR family oxidoreductase [Hyphomicrobiales bacterium]MBO6697907.1 SDR family oxidoreductase [Hyphomicrobiales bacterium]MBO6735839.1 SDR family oxidoreductase [Hyphomicrobiales bacterium]MBO6913850.1 SDR family oxidoreductase [Hyphomicrobiales bacterium]MBO6955553.1 SDR family oxidoreductase [Hyphomicrobiales bacterium]
MKKALVTGGTRGIGAGVVHVLASQGWQVIAATQSEAEIEEFEAPAGTTTARVDVTDQATVDALLAGIDRLDGLVNCAGILMRGEEYDLDNFQKVIDVNLVGTMRMCVAAKDKLAETGGSIVNIASMLTYFGGPLVPAYSASKGGVGQLTKALAGKWAGDGVRVNAVAPGWIDTEMTQALQADPSRNGPLMNRTPMNRWGQTNEVGALVAWLLSDQASFITGSVYPVDGGYSAM